MAGKGATFVPTLPAKPATQAAGPRLASDARSAARRAFDEELAAKETQLEVRSILRCHNFVAYSARFCH